MTRADLVIGTVLAILVGGAAVLRSAQLHPVLYQYVAAGLETSDVWFDADLPKHACMMLDRDARQHASSADHPLVSSVLSGAAVIAGVSSKDHAGFPRAAGLGAAVWTLLFFSLLRRIGCARVDAVAFCLLAASSAAAIMWMAVPELYVLGSLTLLVPIWAIAGRRQPAAVQEVLVSAASLALTTSNWMSGLLTSWVRRPWREAMQISANALMLIACVWIAQSLWFPSNEFFLGSTRFFELARDDERATPLDAITVFVGHSVVMPAVIVKSDGAWRGLSIQGASLGSSGWLGGTAMALWGVLLVLGARQLISDRPLGPDRLVVIGTIAGQLVLHLLVGRETFLYSMHFAPLLILVAAHGSLGRARFLVRALTLALIVTGATNNSNQFARSADLVNDIGTDAAALGAVFQAATECR